MQRVIGRSAFEIALAAALLIGLGAVAENGVGLYFPPVDGAWETINPKAAGWDADRLEEALAYAGESKSSGVVILHKGRILAERYWDVEGASERYQNMRVGETRDGHPIEDVASVQKSVVSFLAALARERNDLKLTDRVSNYLEVGWSQTHRDREHEITLHHIMTMSSGLNPRLDFQAEPGALWSYNTRAYAKMVPVLEAVTGEDIHALTRGWLTGPIGMRDSRWAPRPWVRQSVDANAIGFATSARDLARFGLLVLADGKWNGESILKNAELLRETLRPSQKLNPSYGYLWWLNGQAFSRRSAGGERTDGALLPTAPSDLVAALGALGRKCYVSPSNGLVVTRLGDAPGQAFDREFWRRLSAAMP